MDLNEYERTVSLRVSFALVFVGLLITSSVLIYNGFTIVDTFLYLIGLPLLGAGIATFLTMTFVSRGHKEQRFLKYGFIIGIIAPISAVIYHMNQGVTLATYTIVLAICLSLIWIGMFVLWHLHLRRVAES
ncbi:hypothetical protein [Geomicrobium sp. JCM 19038]|uniref:hypothetical protein n=1 Tax=Geomicrobium sp. JCM 19038 TaxID=1460635 RepID=UPI00045F233A|nr:hypothetical protein [Geomicrobium sp. JCM 19038]GAK08184.1 hypothetical protein JCM19038_1959 [Geomicrobium sp. JCM 19038]